jgi:putative ABC transport system ATP-binding protein
MAAKDELVRLDQVTRVYSLGASKVHALSGINLSVEAGEFLAVMGVSGSGKSTLLHLIGGLDTPTSGQVVVAGHRLQCLSRHERSLYRRRTVGFVFQSFHLVPSMTAAANVALALTFQGIYGAERKCRAAEILGRLGLGHRLDHRPAQLSGGEQQRVALARALVHEPALLLADEPAGNLDRATAAEVISLIRTRQREKGTTVVLVTHDEETALRVADRLVRLRDGQLVCKEQGA